MSEDQPEHQSPSDRQSKQLELWLSFAKVAIGTALVGLTTAVVNWSIQSRQIKLQELQYTNDLELKTLVFQQQTLDTYLEHALDKDQNKRIRMASYFSTLTQSEEMAEKWNNYLACPYHYRYNT